jgi:hypothetical protein
MFFMASLSCRVADSNTLRSLEVLADLPAHEDHRALGKNHLAKVIVELLLGVGVLGVELADLLVCHSGSPSDRASKLSAYRADNYRASPSRCEAS